MFVKDSIRPLFFLFWTVHRLNLQLLLNDNINKLGWPGPSPPLMYIDGQYSILTASLIRLSIYNQFSTDLCQNYIQCNISFSTFYYITLEYIYKKNDTSSKMNKTRIKFYIYQKVYTKTKN